ncbi:sequence-specific DNA binding [Ascochyta rabiei]|uniref:Sequence-specific DNA binding n=2 Tax=Didymella rabiei TaxID=5454 RepID=A0A162ZWL5_DIDRA|nr:sequence-specific DNA binding [Ascochyta rabiei]
MANPLHPYPGPSHSHTQHQSPPANALPGSLAGLLSPPDSRRTSGDDKDVHRPAPRQSLPSISEALGAEQSLPYPGPVPPPPSVAASTPQHYLPASTNPSPSDPRKRPFEPDSYNAQGPVNPFLHPRSPFISTSTSQVPAPPPPPPQGQPDSMSRPSFDPRQPHLAPQHNSRLPSLHPIKTAQSPPPSAVRPNPPYSSYPPAPSSAYEPPAAQLAEPMNHQYGYPPYASYPLSASAPTAYPPPASTYSAPSRYYPTSLRDNTEARMEEKKLNRASLAPYGESVKRHLDSFDLEASLNEMADGCGRISEFSKVYRQRAHEDQRIGMTPQSIPRLEDIEDMIKQGERVQMSLQRMRDVVFNHHQATIAEPPREAHYRRANGYEHDTSSSYGDDMKSGGGFAGADNKTRKRGRAAPPGRCHSCNRAETPEWRRGPDGARTLCNACGLHYAKLTRKIGKDAMTSSNLRPKSIDHGSPAI